MLFQVQSSPYSKLPPAVLQQSRVASMLVPPVLPMHLQAMILAGVSASMIVTVMKLISCMVAVGASGVVGGWNW